MKKLSKTQQEVVNLINDGWELGMQTGLTGRYWIQKGGLCCGGESKNISSATVHALEREGLIIRVAKRKNDQYWLIRFELVEKDNK